MEGSYKTWRRESGIVEMEGPQDVRGESKVQGSASEMPTSILAQERRGIRSQPAPVHLCEKKHRKENAETDGLAASWGKGRGGRKWGE